MERITIGLAEKLTSPCPFALLTVRTPSGETNVMAVSWWTYTSSNPPMVAVSLSNKGFSGKCIDNSGAFGLNFVGESLRTEAFLAGTCSGQFGGKAMKLNIPLITIEQAHQEMIPGSRLWLCCSLKNQINAGDHTLFLGEVESAWGDSYVDALFAFEGYKRLDLVETRSNKE